VFVCGAELYSRSSQNKAIRFSSAALVSARRRQARCEYGSSDNPTRNNSSTSMAAGSSVYRISLTRRQAPPQDGRINFRYATCCTDQVGTYQVVAGWSERRYTPMAGASGRERERHTTRVGITLRQAGRIGLGGRGLKSKASNSRTQA
jgi:hypothetical protein